MKYLTLLTLFFATNCLADLGATSSGGTISWPSTGGWMQVQSESSFETVTDCEGFITSCDTTAGSYKVVDHSSGIFQLGIQVFEATPPTTRPTLFQRTNCTFLSFSFQGECEISCPAGMTIKRIVECRATVEASGLLTPTDFNSDATTLFCRAGSISTNTTMNVGIECE